MVNAIQMNIKTKINDYPSGCQVGTFEKANYLVDIGERLG